MSLLQSPNSNLLSDFSGGKMEPDMLKDIYQLVMALGIIIAVSNLMLIIKMFDVTRTLKKLVEKQ